MTVDEVIANVLVNEGGYANNPADAGGETMYGITVAVARQQGYVGAMRDMPKSFATEVYRRKYVVAPGFDRLLALAAPAIVGPIVAELVDTGVNMGPTVAGRFLQRALNGLVDGTPLVVDGHVGPTTGSTLKSFLDRRGAIGTQRLVALLNAQQGVRYLDLTEARSANRAFLFGWLGRIL